MLRSRAEKCLFQKGLEMPVYEYLCDNCGLRFDKMQKFSDDPLTECPNCAGPVHRVIQPVGVIFKGSGFYVTDNRSKSSTMPPTKRDEGEKSDGAETAEKKPDGAKDASAKPAETQKTAE